MVQDKHRETDQDVRWDGATVKRNASLRVIFGVGHVGEAESLFNEHHCQVRMPH